MTSPLKFSQVLKKPNLENIFTLLGENKNGAVIVTCAIALFKGIFRPLFTMMDKKSDPETKKYAAIREGLTELVALPIYAATPFLIEKYVIEKIFKNKPVEKQNLLKGNAKFLTVCAATLVIPAVCNLIQPPIMNAYKKRQEKKKISEGLDLVSKPSVNNPTYANKPAANNSSRLVSLNHKNNYGMKVGQ